MPSILLAWPGHSSSTYTVASNYSEAFKALGVETADFLYHNQLVWENDVINRVRGTEGVSYEGEAIYLATQVFLGKLVELLPDYVVIVTGLALWKSVWLRLLELRRQLKRPYKLVLLLTESPYRPGEELELANFADYVFSNERVFVPRLRQFQPRSYYLPHAYCPEVHRPAQRYTDELGVYMCGSGFMRRIELLKHVDWSSAELTLRGIWPGLEGGCLEQYYQEGIVPNEQLVEHYHNAAICLNVHRQDAQHVVFEVDRPGYYAEEKRTYKVNVAYSMNNRTVEIAASHGFQLCDGSRREVAEVFGDTVPTFLADDSEELEELVNYYIPRPELRRELAARSAERIEGRTYIENTRKILSKLEG